VGLATTRWETGSPASVITRVDPGDLVLLAGPVLRGTHYLVHRGLRTVAPSVTVGEHVQLAEPAVRARVVAQCIGVAVGLVITPRRRKASVMSQLPVRVHDVVPASSTPAERNALKQQLRWHFLERIRLNDAPPIEVGLDGKLVGYQF
jgi:hypothetical protein